MIRPAMNGRATQRASGKPEALSGRQKAAFLRAIARAFSPGHNQKTGSTTRIRLPRQSPGRCSNPEITMPANSLLRRLAKRALHPILKQDNYQYIQAAAKAWDIFRGTWTEPELDLVPLAALPGDTVLDVGANFGLYTYHMSKAVGPRGKVYAFEPLPFTAKTLRLVTSILRIQNAELVEKGCSDQNGTVRFEVPVQESGAISAGLAHLGERNDARPGKEQHARYDKNQEVTCEVVALDSFLPPDADVSLFKCDIEGAELLAFRGATRLIERCTPTVICEINPWFLEGFGVRLSSLLEFFFGRGYSLYRYQGERGSERLCQVAPSEVVEDNYLFLHPSRASRLSSKL